MEKSIVKAVGSLTKLNSNHVGCIEAQLGIRFTAVSRDFICAEMPVDERTRQPYGFLHGGASVVLAESLGSMASAKVRGGSDKVGAFGIDVSGSHVSAIRSGYVTGVCRPVKLGRTLHFWRIEIFDPDWRLICSARLTVSVRTPRKKHAAS